MPYNFITESFHFLQAKCDFTPKMAV